jgi:toxin-antitoxin system PIN domain toxin
MTSYFPDVNVWLAILSGRHAHHNAAAQWYQSLNEERLCFCRHTQLGVLRLLCNRAVMQEETLSAQEAWRLYESAYDDSSVRFIGEEDARSIDRSLKLESHAKRPARLDWSDTYLLSFSAAAGLHLVTFDRGLARLGGPRSVLLLG